MQNYSKILFLQHNAQKGLLALKRNKTHTEGTIESTSHRKTKL